jgi:hypothetical protein
LNSPMLTFHLRLSQPATSPHPLTPNPIGGYFLPSLEDGLLWFLCSCHPRPLLRLHTQLTPGLAVGSAFPWFPYSTSHPATWKVDWLLLQMGIKDHWLPTLQAQLPLCDSIALWKGWDGEVGVGS